MLKGVVDALVELLEVTVSLPLALALLLELSSLLACSLVVTLLVVDTLSLTVPEALDD